MDLREACLLSYKVMRESAIVEGIIMSDPPENEESYVVQIRTLEDPPQVYRLGPDKDEAYEKKDEINGI